MDIDRLEPPPSPRSYRVSARDREPLRQFIVEALQHEGCRIIYASPPDLAPFRITFETSPGERAGIVVYAFRANSVSTRNRPGDEHRFQVKYGSKDGKSHSLWQDPFGLYTTLFVGINPQQGFFVGADPILHNPTRFFISIEFKQAHVDQLLAHSWFSWERDRRSGEEPVEVLVGGTQSSFLRYVRFEREALMEDQGHRHLLADKAAVGESPPAPLGVAEAALPYRSPDRLHALAEEFQLSEEEVLDLIARTSRLKMAVRGWVAEEHLARRLREVPGVTDCRRSETEGGADVELRYRGSRLLGVQCKNALREPNRDGLIRLDFQRTRASKKDPCSRYYKPGDFDVLAACVHAVTEQWEFRYVVPASLAVHLKCPGRLASNVRLDNRWNAEAEGVLASAAGAR